MKNPENPRPRLYLLDGHALCYRVFYAVQGLTNSKGLPTNAVFGFVNALRKILRDQKPEYMAACFDAPVKTRRQEKFAAYKIHRHAMPDDLIPQIALIKQVTEAFHIPVLQEDGFEADDLIAGLTKRFKSAGDVVIVTDDKDMFQIIDDSVKVYSPRKDALLGSQDVKDIWGVGPEFIADMIALAGDASDNIPGVSGIGKVTAAKLINEYGHLEDIYKNLDAMKPSKTKDYLIRDKDQAFMSRELALFDDEAPVDVTLEELKRSEPDNQKLQTLFQELEFKGFLKDYMPQNPPPVKQAPVADVIQGTAGLENAARKSKSLAWVLDAISPSAGADMFSSVFFSVGPKVWRVSEAELKALKSILEDSTIEKIVYDLKASLKFFSGRGISIAGDIFDVMLAGYVLGEIPAALAFDTLAWKYLQQSPSGHPVSVAALMADLKSVLVKEMKEKNLRKLLDEIEQPLSYVLFEMETRGVAIDRDLLKKLSDECAGKMALIEKDLYAAAGEPFNLNSPKQLSVILFEKLQLPPVKKTKTGYSTDEEVLTQLALQHALPSLILENRQYAKLKSTYLDALPAIADPKTGRIHTEFIQVGAETGRLSSRQPNLQNIPIRTELGRKIRQAFIPSEKDWVLVSVDYSQIELRVLAHLSGDENLHKAFLSGEDIHKYTAAQIFDVSEDKVDYAMRDTAKRVNFGIAYGMSAFGLSKDLNIPVGQAKAFIDKYFQRYPKVKMFMDQCIKECEEKGYVSTILGRRRYLPDIHNRNMAMRQFAQRQAINAPVQGSAADLIKLSMIRIHDELKRRKMKTRMLITVHDELVFEAPPQELSALAQLARTQMEQALKLDIPVKVNVKAGKNWLEMESL